MRGALFNAALGHINRHTRTQTRRIYNKKRNLSTFQTQCSFEINIYIYVYMIIQVVILPSNPPQSCSSSAFSGASLSSEAPPFQDSITLGGTWPSVRPTYPQSIFRQPMYFQDSPTKVPDNLTKISSQRQSQLHRAAWSTLSSLQQQPQIVHRPVKFTTGPRRKSKHITACARVERDPRP